MALLRDARQGAACIIAPAIGDVVRDASGLTQCGGNDGMALVLSRVVRSYEAMMQATALVGLIG